MNHETLWERVNEAVDTIIRRDESSEKGDLLPPCVEGIPLSPIHKNAIWTFPLIYMQY